MISAPGLTVAVTIRSEPCAWMRCPERTGSDDQERRACSRRQPAGAAPVRQRPTVLPEPARATPWPARRAARLRPRRPCAAGRAQRRQPGRLRRLAHPRAAARGADRHDLQRVQSFHQGAEIHLVRLRIQVAQPDGDRCEAQEAGRLPELVAQARQHRFRPMVQQAQDQQVEIAGSQAEGFGAGLRVQFALCQQPREWIPNGSSNRSPSIADL